MKQNIPIHALALFTLHSSAYNFCLLLFQHKMPEWSSWENLRELTVLFIGHSYVKRAKEYRSRNGLTPNVSIQDLFLKFIYIARGGKSYKFFNEDEEVKEEILKYSPDIVLVALAGNSACKHSSNEMQLENDEMRKFHNWLLIKFPNAYVAPIEAEPRFNWHNELPIERDINLESYKQRRKSINSAMSRMACKHGIIRVYNRLNDRNLFKPRHGNGYVDAHLNDEGLEIYLDIIHKGLEFLLRKWKFLSSQ